jgi:hypothetical protein
VDFFQVVWIVIVITVVLRTDANLLERSGPKEQAISQSTSTVAMANANLLVTARAQRAQGAGNQPVDIDRRDGEVVPRT